MEDVTVEGLLDLEKQIENIGREGTRRSIYFAVYFYMAHGHFEYEKRSHIVSLQGLYRWKAACDLSWLKRGPEGKIYIPTPDDYCMEHVARGYFPKQEINYVC